MYLSDEIRPFCTPEPTDLVCPFPAGSELVGVESESSDNESARDEYMGHGRGRGRARGRSRGRGRGQACGQACGRGRGRAPSPTAVDEQSTACPEERHNQVSFKWFVEGGAVAAVEDGSAPEAQAQTRPSQHSIDFKSH